MPSVNVKGVRLNYLEQGTGDEIIVFVHGMLETSRCWKEVLELLPPKYHAYTLDLRGFGQSERVKQGFTMAQFAEDVYNFSQQLGLGRFTYVGHSIGGGIGMQLALEHPEVLKALVLVATVPAHGLELPPDMLALVQGIPDMTTEAVQGLVPFFVTTPLSEERIQELVNDVFLMDREAYLECTEAYRFFNVEKRLTEIDLPTLMISGDKDATNPLDDQRRTAKGIKGCRHVIFDGNAHFLQVESPQKFVDLLASFIKEVSTG